jgi:uncharacterized protein HemX
MVDHAGPRKVPNGTGPIPVAIHEDITPVRKNRSPAEDSLVGEIVEVVGRQMAVMDERNAKMLAMVQEQMQRTETAAKSAVALTIKLPASLKRWRLIAAAAGLLGVGGTGYGAVQLQEVQASYDEALREQWIAEQKAEAREALIDRHMAEPHASPVQIMALEERIGAMEGSIDELKVLIVEQHKKRIR